MFRHAVSKLADAVDEALAANGLAKADVHWLVPHQANLRIIEAMGKKLGLPPERVVVTVDRHANTSAASIPLALAEATRDGRIARGRPGADGGDRRRADLGRGAGPLLRPWVRLPRHSGQHCDSRVHTACAESIDPDGLGGHSVRPRAARRT